MCRFLVSCLLLLLPICALGSCHIKTFPHFQYASFCRTPGYLPRWFPLSMMPPCHSFFLVLFRCSFHQARCPNTSCSDDPSLSSWVRYLFHVVPDILCLTVSKTCHVKVCTHFLETESPLSAGTEPIV